jgi:hypothetical protein
LELKRGPKPTVFTNGPPATKFTSVKIWVSRVPMALWFFVRVVKKAPAAAGRGRGPGSVAVGQGEIGHELPLTTAGRDIKAAMDKAMSSATVTKIEMRRRELDPEFVCIEESSILRMDFQPVLAKTVRSQPHRLRQLYEEIFGGKALAHVSTRRMWLPYYRRKIVSMGQSSP